MAALEKISERQVMAESRQSTLQLALRKPVIRRRPEIGISTASQMAGCEFRRKLDTDSSRSWTVIPRQAGH